MKRKEGVKKTGERQLSSRSEETRSRLCMAMKRLVCRMDYSRIDISMIASESGINRKSFYYHFSSKDALMRYVIERDTCRYAAEMDKQNEGWDRFVTLCRLLYKDRSFYRAVTEYGCIASLGTLLSPSVSRIAAEIFPERKGTAPSHLAMDSMIGALTRWVAMENPPVPLEFLLSYKRDALNFAEGCLLSLGTMGRVDLKCGK